MSTEDWKIFSLVLFVYYLDSKSYILYNYYCYDTNKVQVLSKCTNNDSQIYDLRFFSKRATFSTYVSNVWGTFNFEAVSAVWDRLIATLLKKSVLLDDIQI